MTDQQPEVNVRPNGPYLVSGSAPLRTMRSASLAER